MALLHSLCLLLYHLHETYGQWGSGHGDECIPQCPNGQTLWFKVAHPVLFHNGCGTDHVAFRKKGGVVDICCMIHDVCYKICGTTVEECDVRFRDCVNERCDGWKRFQPECRFIQSTGFRIIDAVGCANHYNEQEKYCKCLPYQEAKKKLEENIKWFYTKTNQQSLINSHFQYLSADIGYGKNNARAINWLLYMIEKYPDKLMQYNGKSTLDTIKNHVKNHVKNGLNHVKNSVAALHQVVKSGWGSIKSGWNSLFGAHNDLYDEYEDEYMDMDQDKDVDNNAQNLYGYYNMRQAGVEMTDEDIDEADEIFVLFLIVLVMVVTLCGFIGCVCGFVVASIKRTK